MGCKRRNNYPGISRKEEIMDWENQLSIEMKPTEEGISLLRLITSYMSNCLDFDIDEIDNLKTSITNIINALKPYWMLQDKIVFKLMVNKNELHARIIFPNPEREKLLLNIDSKHLKILGSLIDQITFEEEPNHFAVIHMKMLKRIINV